MKPALFLLVAILSSSLALGQYTYDGPQILWDNPIVKSQKLERLGIKQIDIQGYELPITRGEGDSFSEVKYYDTLGHVTKIVELVSRDTQTVHTYHYNRTGVLGWKHTRDLRWNRSYKEGYRFNGATNVYQVKAYEMLRNDERMLLDTRQYIYDNDSLLIAIRSMENRRLVSTHRFKYDKQGRIASETFEDEDGKVLQTVSYSYDLEDRVSRVSLDKGILSEYFYEYNNQGQPIQIEWKENGTTKGLVSYQYESNGLVARMDRYLNPETKSENHFVKVFQYQQHP